MVDMNKVLKLLKKYDNYETSEELNNDVITIYNSDNQPTAIIEKHTRYDNNILLDYCPINASRRLVFSTVQLIIYLHGRAYKWYKMD